jgi:hypothetical protein
VTTQAPTRPRGRPRKACWLCRDPRFERGHHDPTGICPRHFAWYWGSKPELMMALVGEVYGVGL